MTMTSLASFAWRLWLRRKRSLHLLHWKVLLSYFRRGKSARESKLRRFLVEPSLRKVVRDGWRLAQLGTLCTLFGVTPFALSQSDALSEIGFGLGCLLVLVSLLILSGVPLALAGLAIVLTAKLLEASIASPPDVSEVRSELQRSVANLRSHSLAKLGLSEEEVADFQHQPPIITPIVWNRDDIKTTDLLWRVEGGQWYFGVYRIVIVHLAREHLGIYLCDFNFLREVSLNDETFELSYQDIVTLRTREVSTSLTLPTGKKINHEQTYTLTVSGGHSIDLGRSIPQLGSQLDETAIPETDTDKAIAGIRANIRDRKLALTHPSRPMAIPQ